MIQVGFKVLTSISGTLLLMAAAIVARPASAAEGYQIFVSNERSGDVTRHRREYFEGHRDFSCR